MQRDSSRILCHLETSLSPHTGLVKGMAERVPFASECQARVRGSTREPLTTLTVWKGERRIPCIRLLSSLPFSTIAYPLVCWGGGLIHYHRTGADALQLTLVPRFSFRARLIASVRLYFRVSFHQ